MNIKVADLLYDIEAKIIGKTGNHISDRVTFQAKSPIELSSDDIFNIQLGLGYHPHGYGTYSLSKAIASDPKGVKTFIYEWHSSACCD